LPWPAAWIGLYANRSAPLAFLLYHLLCFGGGFLLRSPGLPATERIYAPRRGHLFGVVLGANALTLLLYLLVGAALLDRPHILGFLSARGLGPASYLWLFPYFALVNPLAEEFFWRGGVYATFRHLFASPLAAALVAAAVFGAWHWMVFRLFVAPVVALIATGGVVLVGLALTLVYERTRRLAYAVALHALAGDAPLLLLLLLLGRG
jgi:membrane protease YdiL (CAAX protease family)